jgi:ubiquinone biosynthesis protein UbiJ
MLTRPPLALLNHLLAQNSWASARLAPFNGRVVRFKVAPFSFTCTVQSTGLLNEAAADATADATFTIPPSLLPRLALQDESAYAQIQSHGDVTLLEEIFFLARHLRWDAAEDLSRVTGDVAAERMVNFVADKNRQARSAAENVSQALAEYWTEERPLLATPARVQAFAQDVKNLRDAVTQLEQRLSQLAKAE